MNKEQESPVIAVITVCPFAVNDTTGRGGHRCGAQTPPTAISSKYAATYCDSDQHAHCSIFVASHNVEGNGRTAGVAGGASRALPLHIPSMVTGLRGGALVEKSPRERASLLDSIRSRLSSEGGPPRRIRIAGLALALVVTLAFLLPRLDLGSRSSSIARTPAGRQVSETAGQALERASSLIGRRSDTSAAKAGTGRTAASKAASKPVAKKSSGNTRASMAAPAGKPKTTASTGKTPKARRILSERTVEEGDYLRRIAANYYGDEMLWPLVWQYNKQRAKQSGQDLENPDLIYPGWKFYIPKKEQSEE